MVSVSCCFLTSETRFVAKLVHHLKLHSLKLVGAIQVGALGVLNEYRFSFSLING